MRKICHHPIRFSRDAHENGRVHTDVSRFDPISPSQGILTTVPTEVYDYAEYGRPTDKNTSSDTIVAEFNRFSKNSSQQNSAEKNFTKDESKENNYPKNGIA